MIIRYGVAVVGVFLFILSCNSVVGQKEIGKVKCVCLDAGHGGEDPGAVGAKTYEKHITLAIVLEVGKLIQDHYPDVKVVYTRKTDVKPELKERSRFANDSKADLFISVHANSVTNTKVRGIETYVLGSNSSQHNLDVAMKENSVIRYESDYSVKYAGFDPSRPESYIIFNLVKSLHLNQSLEIASAIQKELVKNTQLVDREVCQGPLWVLKDVAMPSTLVEVGFISNPEDERYMMSEAGQDKIVKSIFKGFQIYKSKMDKKAAALHVDDKTAPEPKEVAIRNEERENKVVPKEPEKKENNVPEKKNDPKPLDKPQEREVATSKGERPFYAVQVASATTRIKNSAKLCEGEDVCELQAGGRFRYYVVPSENFDDVRSKLSKIKNKVHDCFIIAVHKGNMIPVAEAHKLLKGIK